MNFTENNIQMSWPCPGPESSTQFECENRLILSLSLSLFFLSLSLSQDAAAAQTGKVEVRKWAHVTHCCRRLLVCCVYFHPSLSLSLLHPMADQAAPHFAAVAKSWEDGPYMFILYVREVKEKSQTTTDTANSAAPWSIHSQFTETHTMIIQEV